MIDELFKSILNEFKFENSDISQYSPLVLAYIGDTVFEVFIRTLVVYKGNAPVYKLHRKSVDFVKAKSQSDTIHRIMQFLTLEELDIVRRGRNAKSGTIPKNVDIGEYKYATGFESLLGFLYLKRDFARLMQVLKLSISEDNNRE